MAGQEESRNISENSKWGIVKGFKDGKGKLIINKEEAEIVKRIYKEYMEGKSYIAIAKGLQRDGIKTGADKIKWWDSTVSIIS